jgi:O-antigen ligase
VYERPTGWSGYPEISHLATLQIAILVAFLQTATSWTLAASVAVLIAVGAVELVLLYARMAWLSLAAVLASAAVVMFGEGRRLLVIAVVGAGLLGGGLLVWQNMTIQRLAYGMVGLSKVVADPSAPYLEIATPEMRVQIWRRTGRMIRDHWLTGVGLGNFQPVYESVYNPELNNDLRRGGHAHNYWLQQTAEVGVVGGAANAGLWAVALWIAWRRRAWSLAHRAALYMIVAIVARHVADNLFFSFGFASARLQSLAWIAVALAIAPRDEPESGGPILTTNSAVMN